MRYIFIKAIIIFFVGTVFAQGDYESKVGAGEMKIQSGDYYGAMDIFNEAAALSPKKPDAYIGLAKARSKLNEFELALKDIERALDADPASAEAWVQSGEIRVQMKEYEKALSDYEKALEIDPIYNKATKNKILALLLLDDKKVASKLLDNSLKRSPDYWGYYYVRGVIQNSDGKFTKALEDFDQAFELNPDDKFEIAINRGFSNLGLQNYTDALNDFNTAIEVDPNNAGAYHSRARTHYLLEDYSAAINDYKESLDRNEDNPVVFYDLGMAYFKMEDLNNACRNFQKACQLGNKNGCKKFLFECTQELDDIN